MWAINSTAKKRGTTTKVSAEAVSGGTQEGSCGGNVSGDSQKGSCPREVGGGKQIGGSDVSVWIIEDGAHMYRGVRGRSDAVVAGARRINVGARGHQAHRPGAIVVRRRRRGRRVRVDNARCLRRRGISGRSRCRVVRRKRGRRSARLEHHSVNVCLVQCAHGSGPEPPDGPRVPVNLLDGDHREPGPRRCGQSDLLRNLLNTLNFGTVRKVGRITLNI